MVANDEGSGSTPLVRECYRRILAEADRQHADRHRHTHRPPAPDDRTEEGREPFALSITESVPIGAGFGLPILGFETSGMAEVTLDFSFDFGFGVSLDDGFFFILNDDMAEGVEMEAGLTVSFQDATLTGNLFFLGLEAVDNGSSFTGTFSIDLDDPDGDGKLTFAEIPGLIVTPALNGEAFVDLALTAGFNSGGMIDLAFPSVSADFVLEWMFNTNDLFGDLPSVRFEDVSLHMGTFLSDFLDPVLDVVNSVIEPIVPIIDVLTAPIPVISDLAGEPVNLLDLAGLFGFVDPGLLESVEDVFAIVGAISGLGDIGDDVVINFGDIILSNSPPDLRAFDSYDEIPGFDSDTLVTSNGLISDTGTISDGAVKGFVDDLIGGAFPGFDIPILTQPKQVVNLIMGRPAALLTYDMKPLSFNFSYSQFFSIFGPLGASVTGSIGATIDFAFGYDTFGLQRFADTGFRYPHLILDGFYVSDNPSNGAGAAPLGEGPDAPEITITGSLLGAAELNLGVARAGVGGGVELNLGFDLNDPNHDGRVRGSEMIGNLLLGFETLGIPAGAIAIFDVVLEVNAILEWFLEFIVGPSFGGRIGEVNLLTLEFEFPKPPILGTTDQDGDGINDGGELRLNMGPLAMDRLYDNVTDGDENFTITQTGGDGNSATIQVSAFGETQTFENVTNVYADAGFGNDVLSFVNVQVPILVKGGFGDDLIDLGPDTTGAATITGDSGNDTIIGGDGDDSIDGGKGDDSIVGGGGNDTIWGRTENDVLLGGPGNDWIDAGAGDDTVNGQEGDDTIYGMAGDDSLLGGLGHDLIFGGTDNDWIIGGDSSDLGPDGNDTAFGESGNDIIIGDHGEIGSVTLLGGGGNDCLNGGFGDDSLYGDTGNDTLLGDAGHDWMRGNEGDDSMLGSLGYDTMFGDDGDDTIRGQSDDDLIFGGAGRDLIFGDAGHDILFGDDGLVAYVDFFGPGMHKTVGDANPTLVGSFSHDGVKQTLDLIVTEVNGTTDGDDTINGGAGLDTILGGAKNDLIFGDFDPANPPAQVFADNDMVFGDGGRVELNQRRLALVKSLPGADAAETGDDTISGNGGSDILFGGGADDWLYGRMDESFSGPNEDPSIADNDVLIGDDGEIIVSTVMLEGNPRPTTVFSSIATDISADAIGTGGNDTAFGNKDNDTIFGGIAMDTLQGDAGDDVILGDNGQMLFDALGIIELIETTDSTNTTGGDDDTISGHAGADTLIGGSADDLIYGDNTTGDLPVASPAGDVILGDQGELAFDSGTLLRIETTDVVEADGGSDTIEGNQGNDTILGGTFGDLLRGNEGADVILGDEGRVRYDVAEADGIPGTGDGDPLTIDLVETKSFTLGGNDTILGNAANDTAFGGSGGDLILGDNDETVPNSGVFDFVEPSPGMDVLIGDQGRILYLNENITRVETTDLVDADGGSDTIEGNDLDDIILGGVAGDLLRGEAKHTSLVGTFGHDILLGDEGLLRYDLTAGEGGDDDIATLDLITTGNPTLGGDDTIFGNDGSDIALGGAADDLIYGDLYDGGSLSTSAFPGMDILIGDGGRLEYFNAAPTLITTIDPSEGGSDTIEGNEKNDTILGGASGDLLFGEAADVNLGLVTVVGGAGNDVILGDNGELNFILTSDAIEGRPDVAFHLGGTNIVTLDPSPTTLDRITTHSPNDGGDDTIKGNGGSDTVFGGTGKDLIYGDTSDAGPGPDGPDGDDLLFGDHAKIYPHIQGWAPGDPFFDVFFLHNNFFAIDTQAIHGGDNDTIFGNASRDTLIGQQGDDVLFGGADPDDMIGGHNVVGGHDELDPMDQALIDAILSGVPADSDPTDINDINDVMDGGSEADMMAGDNAIMIRIDDSTSPRFRQLAGPLIYNIETVNLDGLFNVDMGFSPNITGDHQLKPGSSVGHVLILLDHTQAIQDAAAADPLAPRPFGNDVMAGGSQDDEMFGQLGDDIMQGDGTVQFQADPTPIPFNPSPSSDPSFTIPDDQTVPTYFNVLGQRLRFHVVEAASDGDDYMEGNGGNDRLYGNLGQDDMIGGSSSLFGLDDGTAMIFNIDPADNLRPDAADLMYGGAGNPTRLDRNDYLGTGTTAPTDDDPLVDITQRHARDADTMLGDNANVFRLLDHGGQYLQFNYDQSFNLEDRGTLRIIPSVVELLDYEFTYTDLTDPTSLTFSAIGLGDLMYGESGDDAIWGMTGNDVLFGNSEDDNLHGQQGHDWISGGTGVDGILGDDGLIFTSRNSTVGEPLYGIAGFIDGKPGKFDDPQLFLNAEITTPGNIQRAIINVKGELKNTVNLIAFEAGGNDILFGGLNNDWMHGGEGDDAMAGSEALSLYYDGGAVGFTTVNNLLKLQQAAPSEPGPAPQPEAAWYAIAPYNPGDILRFEGNNPGTQEFALYDEFNPRRKIMLDANGQAVATAAEAVYGFLLNFDPTEGPLGFAYEGDPAALPTDGDDRMFGDTGNDWMVGGTGRDNMFGGRGHDLLNMDDHHDSGAADPNGNPKTSTTDPLDNTNADEFQAYADIAYGGAGRDVLILNTGADRAIDWFGEFNSYIVPFSPFGAFHISRTIQPQLPEFLLALSESDGTDVSAPDGARYVEQKQADVRVTEPDPLRNGEPYGELGMLLQREGDFHPDLQDQTGAPADPQAGNFNGKREIMRRELFTDSGAETLPFAVEEGTATVSGGMYHTAPTSQGGEFISLYHLDMVQPPYMEILVTANIDKAKAGWKANAYVIFDYQGPTDFKFAGIDSGLDKVRIGHRTADGWIVDAQTNMQLNEGRDYNLTVVLHGTVATVYVGATAGPSFDFKDPLTEDFGMIGLGADNATARFDNFQVQKLPPLWTFTFTEAFDDSLGAMEPESGGWATALGRAHATAPGGGDPAVALYPLTVAPSSRLETQTVVQTAAIGGLVFDYYSPDDFKFAALDAATGQIIIGHHTKHGLQVDSSVGYAVNLAHSYALGLSLMGSSVSVTVNGQAVAGYVYNSLLNDGDVGLLAHGGSAAFDSFMVRGDDPAFLPEGSPMLAATPAHGPHAPSVLTEAQLLPVYMAAIDRWNAILGPGAVDAEALMLQIADLPGDRLGFAQGNILTIDLNAAGHGWFVDSTPTDDSEFAAAFGQGLLVAVPRDGAARRMDLLTVVMHEVGHTLGLEDLNPHVHRGDVMSATLHTGMRLVTHDDGLHESETHRDSVAAFVNGDDSATDALALASVPAPARPLTAIHPPLFNATLSQRIRLALNDDFDALARVHKVLRGGPGLAGGFDRAAPPWFFGDENSPNILSRASWQDRVSTLSISFTPREDENLAVV